MSRNKEKARSSLNRYHNLKAKEAGVLESDPNLRPKYVQSVQSLAQAEKWRSVVLSEISVKLGRIQDLALSDYQIRDLNDSLNSLFREKRSWEYHIKDLGGPDYINFGKNMQNVGYTADRDSLGAYVKGYRYFGRAKDLPDVKEIIEMQEHRRHKGTNKTLKAPEELEKKKDLKELLTPFYYGMYDEMEDETSQAQMEQQVLESLNKASGQTSNPLHESKKTTLRETSDPLLMFEQQKSSMIRKKHEDQTNSDQQSNLISQIKALPKQDQVEKWILEKRKKSLLLRLGLLEEK